jgi:hypothetical protein
VRRRSFVKIIVLVAISGFVLSWVGIGNIVYALNPNRLVLDAALGQLARAESAQTPNEVVHYLIIAKARLPESGAIAWWSAEKGDFKSIQAELDDMIIRAENISSMQLGDELFNSEMYAIHGEIRMMQETLV